MQAEMIAGWKTRSGQILQWIWRGSLVIFFSWVAASVAWISIRSEDFPAAHLEPDPSSLDLGAHWPQTELAVPLTIRNHGSRPILIRDFEASHPVRPTPATPIRISANQSANITLGLDLPQLLASDPHADTDSWDQPFALLVRPLTNWGRAPLPWRIRGVARRPVRGLPSTLSFGSFLIEGVVPEPREVELEVHPEIDRLEVTSNSPLVRAEMLRHRDSTQVGGQHYTLRVIPQPVMTAQPGPFNVLLRTTAVATDGTPLVGPNMFVAGGVVRDLQLVPSQLLVTHGRADETHERWLSLQSRTGREFDVVGWEMSSDDVHLTVDPISTRDDSPTADQTRSRSFRLNFEVHGLPRSMSHIRFEIQYRDSETIETYQLPVRWVPTGQGVAP